MTEVDSPWMNDQYVHPRVDNSALRIHMEGEPRIASTPEETLAQNGTTKYAIFRAVILILN